MKVIAINKRICERNLPYFDKKTVGHPMGTTLTKAKGDCKLIGMSYPVRKLLCVRCLL